MYLTQLKHNLLNTARERPYIIYEQGRMLQAP